MAEPTMDLRLPDGRSLDVYVDLSLAVDSMSRIIDQLLAEGR